MKHFTTILLIAFSTTFFAQGYGVVAYFSKTVAKREIKFTTAYDCVKFKFSTKENFEVFKKPPKKYIPAYGGYCAYAIDAKGKKASIDPKTFEIRNGKLYLFYNSWGTNTLELWEEEGAEKLKQKADKTGKT